MYLLDTDTCIYLLNRRIPTVEQRLKRLHRDEVGISTITAAELYYGAAHSRNRRANEARVEVFCTSLTLVPFDLEAAQIFGATKEHLASRGEMVGALDLLIAAVAAARDAVLVTHNIREFRRIPKLKLEDWFEESS